MKKQKQRFKKYLLATIIFCAVFVVATTIKAGVNDSLSGWSWGGSESSSDGNINNGLSGNETGIGWISMNNTNTSGGVSYGVNLPTGNTELSGYAWSENLGWIAFDNSNGYLTGCPAGNGACSARRNGDKLEGWARFTSIKDALDAGNSGGWQGWIKLNGTNYGVEISKMDGTGANKTYAWSDELGWIDFSRAKLPAPPTVTVTADGTDVLKIDLGASVLPRNATIAWSSTDATTCDATGGWTATNIGTSGTHIVAVSGGISDNFTITCQGPGGNGSDFATIMTVCYPKTCISQACVNDISGIRTGVSNTNICTNSSTCSVDPDCQTRSVGDWKEVAP